MPHPPELAMPSIPVSSDLQHENSPSPIGDGVIDRIGTDLDEFTTLSQALQPSFSLDSALWSRYSLPTGTIRSEVGNVAIFSLAHSLCCDHRCRLCTGSTLGP